MAITERTAWWKILGHGDRSSGGLFDKPPVRGRFPTHRAVLLRHQEDDRSSSDAAGKYGLKLHAGKTKILTTSSQEKNKQVSSNGGFIKVLGPQESERHLGRRLCLGEFHQAKLNNRLQAAWATFSQYSAVSRSKYYTFAIKAKLF
jgi:hypothetical protein